MARCGAQYGAAAMWTETAFYRCPVGGGLSIECQITGHRHGRLWYNEQGRMPASSRALALPALAMEGKGWFSFNAIAHRATGTATGQSVHGDLLSTTLVSADRAWLGITKRNLLKKIWLTPGSSVIFPTPMI